MNMFNDWGFGFSPSHDSLCVVRLKELKEARTECCFLCFALIFRLHVTNNPFVSCLSVPGGECKRKVRFCNSGMLAVANSVFLDELGGSS